MTSGLKDAGKPDGEACNDDGTLEEESEMDWLDSPTDLEAPASPPTLKHQAHSDENCGDGEDEKDEEDLDIDGNDDSEDIGHKRTKRRRVSE